ncbi:MAG: radical SAM protein [Patescibacteria group bacterium]
MKPIKDKFVLLFNPHPVRIGRTVTPLGLLAISSFLERDGYDIRIYHSSERKRYLEVLDHLDQAICVGITSMTGYQIIDGLNFAELVRRKNKDVPIIWGGVHPTIKPIQTVKHPLVDIVVRGQGEETFYELVKVLDKGLELAEILGIVYKKDNEIIENPLRPVRDINEFPPLPYHLLDDSIENYITRSGHGKRQLPIITSSGCPFGCSFCYLSTPEFKRAWNAFPPERVIKEIEYLVKKYNLSSIDIRDSNFFVDKERARQIFQGIIEKKLNISFTGVNGRVDQLARCEDEFWQLMEEAGVKEILIGAESGDQEMLNLINKGITPEITLECVRIAAKYKINIVNSLMTNFPPTANDPAAIKKVIKRELNNTTELTRKMFEIYPLINMMLFFYTPYPGTPLYQLCLKSGFKDPQTLEEWGEIDLNTQTVPWADKSHVNKVLLLNDLFVLKKITSPQYLKEKKYKGAKHFILKYLGLCSALNWWVTLRLKYKIYFFPFERLLFSLSKIMYYNSNKKYNSNLLNK